MEKPTYDKYYLDCINNPHWIKRIVEERKLSLNFPKVCEYEVKIQAYVEWRRKYDNKR